MVRLNAEVGTPVMRPLFLQFEADSSAYSQEYEYMYGSDLLVAPVLLPGVETWTVYLPGADTRWLHLWTEDEFQGQTNITVSAPLGNPPVFYRENSPWRTLFRTIGSQFSLS